MSDFNFRENGIAFLEEAFNRTYQIECPDSHPDDFASNLEQFDSATDKRPIKSPSNLRQLDSDTGVVSFARAAIDAFATHASVPPTSADFVGIFQRVHSAEYFYQSWLRNGNCPPPRPPQASLEVQVSDTSAGSGSISETKTGSAPGESKNSTQNSLTENWKSLAIAGGLIATAWACVGVSAFLVADDVTGVGAADDAALAVTLPAAAEAATGAVAEITPLITEALPTITRLVGTIAAGGLVYFGFQSEGKSEK